MKYCSHLYLLCFELGGAAVLDEDTSLFLPTIENGSSGKGLLLYPADALL